MPRVGRCAVDSRSNGAIRWAAHEPTCKVGNRTVAVYATVTGAAGRCLIPSRDDFSMGRRAVLGFTDGVDMPLNFSNQDKSRSELVAWARRRSPRALGSS